MSPLAAHLLAVALAVAAVAAGQTPCSTFLHPLMPCMSYITGKGPSVPVPAPCCKGAKSMTGMMTTHAERVAACTCFKDAAEKMQKQHIDYGRVSALPGHCHVAAPFNFSLDIHCDKIKAAALGPEAEKEHL